MLAQVARGVHVTRTAGRCVRSWNPWGGGEWCAPFDPLQLIMMHLQVTYYLARRRPLQPKPAPAPAPAKATFTRRGAARAGAPRRQTRRTRC